MNKFSVKITAQDLESQVDKLRRKQHRRATIALHSTAGWDGPATLTLGGEPVQVHVCPTPLSLRSALRPKEGQAPWQFFITPLTDDDLPLDLKEKLGPHHRILPPNLNDSLKAKFSATRQHSDAVDDRTDIPAILSYLDHTEVEVRPAPASVLSADHVSQELLFAGLFNSKISTLAELLTWSAGPHATSSWERFTEKLSERVRTRALAWLRTKLGSNSGGALRHLEARGPAGLVAHGLVAEVLVPAPGEDSAAQTAALGGFRFTSGAGDLRSSELEAWAQAAVAAFRVLPDEDKSVAMTAHALLTSPQQLNSPNLVHLSSVMDEALDRRLTSLGAALEEYLVSGETRSLYPAHAAIHGHVGATSDNRDVRTADAVLRLIQWRQRGATQTSPTTIAGWLNHYRDELSWVDTCLNAAWWRQDNQRLGEAARVLVEQVREHRVGADRTFAAAVAATGTNRASASEVLLIEDVLSDVLKPLLGTDMQSPRPTLFVVIDGCSVPAVNDLIQSIMSTYPGTWQELLPASDRLRTALAALPTITTVSRTSLLSGHIASGSQNVENSGFTSAYQSFGGNAASVALLHKNDIETGINDRVSDLIEDIDDTPLVGAILNEIDDSLSSANPMDRTWTAREVRFLADLLKRAGRVGRTVVLVSDHGHIAERHVSGMVSGTDASSARWRPATGTAASEGEIQVRGTRVVANASSEAILAVDDTIRYTGKSAGYHGGLSLAEACVPITVLTQSAADFTENETYPGATMTSSLRYPSWWEIRETAPATPALVEKKISAALPSAASPELGQAALDFAMADHTPAPNRPKDRFDALVESSQSLLRTQVRTHQIHGRSVDDVIGLLRDLAANRGRLPVSSLRQRWGLSNLAMRGSVSSLQRIVNMDGIEVLTVENTDLVLNTDLLFEQFGV